MSTENKINANRMNSKRSTGPKSAAGKCHSAHNAVKHGIFANEIFVTEREKPEFEALRHQLYDQFAPATPMQHCAFDRVLCCCWRGKLATRLEMNRLKAHLECEAAENASSATPPWSPAPTMKSP